MGESDQTSTKISGCSDVSPVFSSLLELASVSVLSASFSCSGSSMLGHWVAEASDLFNRSRNEDDHCLSDIHVVHLTRLWEQSVSSSLHPDCLLRVVILWCQWELPRHTSSPASCKSCTAPDTQTLCLLELRLRAAEHWGREWRMRNSQLCLPWIRYCEPEVELDYAKIRNDQE